MVNQFYTGSLFIIKASGKEIVIHEDIDSLSLEVFKII